MFLQLEDGSLLSLGHICQVIPRNWAKENPALLKPGTSAPAEHGPLALLINGSCVKIQDMDFARLKHRFCGESWDTVEVE